MQFFPRYMPSKLVFPRVVARSRGTKMKGKHENLYWIRTQRSYGWGYYVFVYGSSVPCWTSVPGRGTMLNLQEAQRAVSVLGRLFGIVAEIELA
jgi:hypothetical protein